MKRDNFAELFFLRGGRGEYGPLGRRQRLLMYQHRIDIYHYTAAGKTVLAIWRWLSK